MKTCSIDGCKKPVRGKGWCGMHYQRWVRWGDTNFKAKKQSSPGEPERFMKEHVLPYKGDSCFFWPYGKFSSGRAAIHWNGKTKKASRVVCEEIHGPPPTLEHQAAHSCGKGHLGCCAPNHLRWATPVENAEDMVKHGTVMNGARNHKAKLTEADVRQIRKFAETVSQSEIARRYGLYSTAVHKIVHRKTWAYLE